MREISKYCEDCVHNEVCRYEAYCPTEHCNDKDVAEDYTPTGEWIKSEFRIVCGVFGKFDYLCSRCTNRFDYPFAFCPNCGAKMEMKGLFK